MAEEVLRRLVERGDRDRQRQTDQEQSIKATEYIGNGYVRQIGQAPTRSRYLGNAGLVPGELVAPLGHGQQDVIIHKKPVPFFTPETEEETIVQTFGGDGLFIYFDVSWSIEPYSSNPFNQAFSVDLFRTSSKKMYILRGDARIYETGSFSPTVPTGDFELIAVNTIPRPSRGSTYFHPLFKPTGNLTLNEFSRLKSFARTGRVIIEGEQAVWTTYNNHIVNGLGLSDYLDNFSQTFGAVSANLSISRSDERLNKILIDNANYPSILLATTGHYTLHTPDNDNNAPIGIFEISGKYAFFYVPGSFF